MKASLKTLEDKRLRFLDLFAGCGGISLGFTLAGLQGVFAVEKAKDAFSTLSANLIEGPENLRFSWPSWLERRPYSIQELLKAHGSNLTSLMGSIDVIAGGPPCQGFSLAGRRRRDDPRNSLFKKYVELVAIIRPKVLIVENVPAMRAPHVSARKSYFEKLMDGLKEIGYRSEGRLLDAQSFGVPQRRPRLIVVGVRDDLVELSPEDVFRSIEACRTKQLIEFGLVFPVGAQDAISDLEPHTLVPCDDPASRSGFLEPLYGGPKTPYQRLMNAGAETIDSMRLANHSELVRRRFKMILKISTRGVNVSAKIREDLGMLKHRTVPMAPDKPAPTLTTLPDDLLHYEEPRILSVREYARLQSFPDWFAFRGVYTTGGKRRRTSSPRYTQVGNAVPPLLARAIGMALGRLLKDQHKEAKQQVSDERHEVALI